MPTFAVPFIVLLAALAACTAGRPERSSDGYLVRSTGGDATSLLAADEEVWKNAVVIAWGPDPYATQFRALHSTAGLWVRFDAQDSAPWHTLEERDAQLWNEEVVEIFIDPDRDGANYAELEINPANVVVDLAIFQGQPDLRSDISWSFTGLRSQVTDRLQDGGLEGWTAVALLPWADFATLPSTSVSLPPRPGDVWGFNVFRIKRPGGPEHPERDAIYAAWSPTPGPSFHAPEVFRSLEFEE